MRDTVEKAFLDALKAENNCCEQGERGVTQKHFRKEKMWRCFDEEVREIIYAELIH